MNENRVLVYRFLKRNAKKKTILDYLTFLHTGEGRTGVLREYNMHLVFKDLPVKEQLLIVHKITLYFLGK